MCLIEWRALIPSVATTTSNTVVAKKFEGKSSAAAEVVIDDNKKINLRSLLRQLFVHDNNNDSSTLSNYTFCIFCIISIIISSLPTSMLPLGLLSFGIALRLLPHLPTFQTTFTQNYSTTTYLVESEHYQFGLMYLSVGFHFLIQISRIGGPVHIGNLLFVVWMSDTGALIMGRVMKKNTTTRRGEKTHAAENIHRHYYHETFLSFLKSISPGKTLPGLLGAVITGPMCSIIYPISLPSSTINYTSEEQCVGENTTSNATLLHVFRRFNEHSLCQRMILGLILSLAGIVGDLTESSVKRVSKKKDSGGILPGHGGVVDRFDSLFVAGVVYYYWML